MAWDVHQLSLSHFGVKPHMNMNMYHEINTNNTQLQFIRIIQIIMLIIDISVNNTHVQRIGSMGGPGPQALKMTFI